MGKKNKKRIKRTFFYIGLILITFLAFFPFLYMLLSSFKTNADLFNVKKLVAFTPTLQNYVDVFVRYEFLKPLRNTLIVSCISTVVSMLIGVPAAYSIARFKQTAISSAILAVRIIPAMSLLVPWYMIFKGIGLQGTFTSLILCHMLVSLPMLVWIMIPHFESLPASLEESAMIDGCTRQAAFARIMIPISVPGLITSTLLVFIGSWNNFLFGLILGNSKTQPLPVAMFSFISYIDVNWAGMMAAASVITLPIIVISLSLQKYVVAGLTAGAVKE